jgi:hypothetical protein
MYGAVYRRDTDGLTEMVPIQLVLQRYPPGNTLALMAHSKGWEKRPHDGTEQEVALHQDISGHLK